MSDDLVKRLREAAKGLRSFYMVGAVELIPAGTMDEAADRIEELDAKLAKLAHAAKSFAAIKIKDGRSQPGEIGRTDVTNLRAALAELKGEDRG